MFNLFKYMARKKADVVGEVVEVVATEEKTVATPERDEAFFKAHKSAREDVIYG